VSPLARDRNDVASNGKRSTHPSISPLRLSDHSKPSSFPLSPPSPSLRKSTAKPCPLDNLSPLSNKRKGKAKAIDVDADDHKGANPYNMLSDSDEDELTIKSDDDIATRGKGNLRPFPMSTQMLESITSRKGSSRKRLSDSTDSGKKKRRKEEIDDFDMFVLLQGFRNTH
jgi:hypothetical protein